MRSSLPRSGYLDADPLGRNRTARGSCRFGDLHEARLQALQESSTFSFGLTHKPILRNIGSEQPAYEVRRS